MFAQYINIPEILANGTNFFWFLFAMVCFNLTPGVDSLLLLRSSIKGGFKTGFSITLGIVVSTLTWGLFTVVGLSALISNSPTGFILLKTVGGIYLIYLALTTLYRSIKSPENIELDVNNTQVSHSWFKGIRTGFITDFFNPTVGAFNLTFFPQFLPKGTDHTAQYLVILVAIQVGATLVTYTGMSYLANLGAKIFAKPIAVKLLDWVTAALFLYFGVELLLTARG